MDLLKRSHAPITPEAWKQIDDEAKRVLQLNLAGRKLVDFDGPHGWQYAAVNTGRLTIRTDGGLGVPWGVREVAPLIEVRVPFELPIMELDNASRGAVLDLAAVVSAAEKTAHAEDNAIFNGFKAGGIDGIIPTASHPAMTIPDDYADYPSIVVDAVETLRRARYQRALRVGAWAGLLRGSGPGRGGRLPDPRARRALPRRADGAGAEGRRRGAALASRRRLSAQRRTGPVDRIRGARPGQGPPLPDRVVRLPRAGARRGRVPQAEARQEVATAGVRSRWLIERNLRLLPITNDKGFP